MKTIIFRFTRFSDVDIEFANENYPMLATANLELALLEQFRAELLGALAKGDGQLSQAWTILSHHYTAEELIVWVKFSVPNGTTSQLLVDKIQDICYEEGWMTGNFQVIDEYPKDDTKNDLDACCQVIDVQPPIMNNVY